MKIHFCLSIVWAFGSLWLAGCQSRIDATYGRRTGAAAASVNGTTVLGEMFAGAGHEVRSWSALSPSLQDADVIVWAPDDFELPTSRVQAWLEDWLQSGFSQRVLVYVGRDYDAAPSYWANIQSQTPAGQKAEVTRRKTKAQTLHDTNRSALPSEAEWTDWFSLDASAKKQTVKQLSGPWSEDVDAAQTEIVQYSRLLPVADANQLLVADDGTPVVSEIVRSGAFGPQSERRLILVENGSFLLNLPLVNHEHRKLAGKLVDHIGQPSKRVVFLQSRTGGPPIRKNDPVAAPSSGLALFGVWPLSGALVHLAALGIVFALARWPIFGLPRQPARESLTDFGAHAIAIGKLLERSGDTEYARMLLRNWRQAAPGDADQKDTISTRSPSQQLN